MSKSCQIFWALYLPSSQPSWQHVDVWTDRQYPREWTCVHCGQSLVQLCVWNKRDRSCVCRSCPASCLSGVEDDRSVNRDGHQNLFKYYALFSSQQSQPESQVELCRQRNVVREHVLMCLFAVDDWTVVFVGCWVEWVLSYRPAATSAFIVLWIQHLGPDKHRDGLWSAVRVWNNDESFGTVSVVEKLSDVSSLDH